MSLLSDLMIASVPAAATFGAAVLLYRSTENTRKAERLDRQAEREMQRSLLELEVSKERTRAEVEEAGRQRDGMRLASAAFLQAALVVQSKHSTPGDFPNDNDLAALNVATGPLLLHVSEWSLADDIEEVRRTLCEGDRGVDGDLLRRVRHALREELSPHDTPVDG